MIVVCSFRLNYSIPFHSNLFLSDLQHIQIRKAKYFYFAASNLILVQELTNALFSIFLFNYLFVFNEEKYAKYFQTRVEALWLVCSEYCSAISCGTDKAKHKLQAGSATPALG